MIKNVIFGKNSKITTSISRYFKDKDIDIHSSNNLDFSKLKNYSKTKTNFIFNNFYPSFKLNDLNSSEFKSFVDQSIVKLIDILSHLPKKNINKIIYTSSASVYNLINSLEDNEVDSYNRKLYSSFKYSAEKIIQNFCQKKKINFYIIRIFNTYGDSNDKFSFIENLIKVKKKNLKLKLINNGISIRDFIHLSDVGTIYKKFLINNYESGTYDLGTGNGVLIRNLVDFLEIKKEKIINKNNISQIEKSIANVDKLKKNIGNYKFYSIEKYLRKDLKLNNNHRRLATVKINYFNNKYEGSAIYGAGYAGKRLLKNLESEKEKVIYFIDDDIKKHNTLVSGIPVISFKDLKEIDKKRVIDKVFIAIPSLNEMKILDLSKKLSKFFFDVRYLPEKKFLFNNKINLDDIEIDHVNSFLNRKPFNIKKIRNLKNKNILVTGAAGTIGFEICRQLIFQGAKKIIGIDHSEIAIYQKKNKLDENVKLLLCDINDFVLLDQIVSNNKINLIIHAAAYKHVNILEENINTAITNNIIGTKRVCEIAIKNKTNLIMISTDKAANPQSILGYSKKVCEHLIHYYNLQNKSNYFNIVRFGNVFGSSGSAVTKFIEQINNDEPLTITNKSATRFFMTILEACYLVLETSSFKIKNKTFILNMGKPINIYQLAKKLGKYKKNLDPNYKIKFIETGLKKNEKLHECLFEKKEILHKVNNNVFYVHNKKFEHEKFIKLFLDLENNFKFYSKKKIINCLKSICKF